MIVWKPDTDLTRATEHPVVNLQHSPLIARSVGIVAIASGFVAGMYGLEHPESIWLRTALALIATGLIAQGYALYCLIQRARGRNHSQNK